LIAENENQMPCQYDNDFIIEKTYHWNYKALQIKRSEGLLFLVEATGNSNEVCEALLPAGYFSMFLNMIN